MTTRYVSARRDGAWHVLDRETGETVESFAPGPEGASAAALLATRLNRPAPSSRQARQGFDLRAWRVAHGLSQAGLARLLGVRWLAVQRWEAGTRSLPALLERALRDLDHELDPGRGRPA